MHELVIMALLLVGGLLLVIVSWRLLRSYAQGWWDGPFGPEHWRAGGAAVSLLTGAGLLWLLWRDLDHIAARMGLTAFVLAVMLVTELDIGGRTRRRR
jgi:hypothetical protein